MSTKLMSKSMAVILAVLITAVFAISSQQAFGKDDPNAKSPKVEKSQPKGGPGQSRERVKERMDNLSKELNLTKEQQEKIGPIFENEMKEMRTVKEDSSLTPEQKREKVKAIHQTTRENINKILTPDQQKKFAEMKEDTRENRQGMVEKRIEMMSENLNLTEQQKKDIKPIIENEMKEMRTVREDSSLTPEQRREKTKAIRQTTKEAINKILTPDQQKKYAEMEENRQKMAERRGESRENRHRGPKDSNSK
jgi:Spy/CpxP family protein refolding chaperone